MKTVYRCSKCGAVSHIFATGEIMGSSQIKKRAALYKPQLTTVEEEVEVGKCSCKWSPKKAEGIKRRMEKLKEASNKIREEVAELRARCPHPRVVKGFYEWAPGHGGEDMLCELCGEPVGHEMKIGTDGMEFVEMEFVVD